MDSSPTPSTNTQPIKGWPVYKEAGADVVGELIAGRHKIIRRLAKGGMADVFLAKETVRKCRVAIKILRSRNSESVRRFKVEGEILSNLQHPHIVRAVDVGETADGQPFMALEYLEGETLSARLARGPLPWRDVVAFGVQIADAVHALHIAGIIHRDLKPDNFIITTGDDRVTVKVIDLGVASVGASYQDVQDTFFTPDPPTRHPTQLGHLIGTPPYLPPEAGYCPAEPRLDVYSLGVTLFQLCTQLLPPVGGRPIREVLPASDAPDDLSRLLQAALALDPEERLPSADHLRRGLEAILAAHPPSGSRRLFGGCYDLLGVLGVGASSIVYRASDRELSREVAVKVLRDAKPSDDDVIRFRRAAKVLAAVQHDSIPTIRHFVNTLEQRFAVTTLCTGSPATNYVRPDNHLRPDEVIVFGLQLAGALAAVHAAGIVYRDLHPGNVLIARGDSPRAWIFDFDQSQVSPEFYAARIERWATPPEERQEPQYEKPLRASDYAAPEVRGGAAFSAASDVYALGLLLYRLLTGRRSFPVAGGEVVPPRKLCPACPRGLEGLLLAMLNPRPDMRPALPRILCALEDEQAEFNAELTEHEDSSNENEAGASKVSPAEHENSSNENSIEPQMDGGEHMADTDPAASSDTVIAESSTAFVSATNGVVPATAVASSAPREIADPRPAGRLWRVWVVGLTAAVSLAIGRASVPQDGAVNREASLPTSTAQPNTERPEAPVIDERPPSPEGSPPAPQLNDASLTDDAMVPPVLPPAPTQRQGRISRPSLPGAVTTAEATTAATSVIPRLRECEDVPRRLTVGLDIIRGRGVVTTINQHAPDDLRHAWHRCVKQGLEALRFPLSTTASRVEVRLIVR